LSIHTDIELLSRIGVEQVKYAGYCFGHTWFQAPSATELFDSEK